MNALSPLYIGMIFRTISMLRKVCNHPDLLDLENKPIDFGTKLRSGKLKVLELILNEWKQNNHKCLIFCQTIQFLNIVESFINLKLKYNYLRLDGKTAIRNRQKIISSFN